MRLTLVLICGVVEEPIAEGDDEEMLEGYKIIESRSDVRKE